MRLVASSAVNLVCADAYITVPVQIEFGFVRGQPFIEEILWALGLRVLCSALATYMGWWR